VKYIVKLMKSARGDRSIEIEGDKKKTREKRRRKSRKIR
jgi:hypothetical protein